MATTGLISSNWKSSSKILFDDCQAASDESLVAAAKNGDRSAFDELCKRHTPKMLRTTHRITRNREDSEDAVQECFLNAFVHLRSFDGRSRFSTWLTRIALNAALMKLRRNRACREVATEETFETSELGLEYRLADPSPNPEQRYAESEREAILRGGIAKLRPAIRKAVEIQLQVCSLEESAKILGLTLSAVKARMFHARAALRQDLQSHLRAPAIFGNSKSNLHPARRAYRRRDCRKQWERCSQDDSHRELKLMG